MKTIRVVLTGPECTGKSTLSARLAGYFNTVFNGEYARDYVEALKRDYTYDDILHIAKTQLSQVTDKYGDRKIVFFDTWLIITKIWFKVIYGNSPDWIDDELKRGYIDLWLICATDIPWYADGIRENGGEMREKLFTMYMAEVENIGGNYAVIKGTGDQRFLNAIAAIKNFFPDICP